MHLCGKNCVLPLQKASSELCHALALTAKCLAVELVDPVSIFPLLSCRLPALDKHPGVRPIGIGEVPRRIIAKTILAVVRDDIQSAVGSLQLSAGQISGVEAAVYAVWESFQKEETKGVLLVDARNDFNCFNCKVALHNICFICPPLTTILINYYLQSLIRSLH